MTKRRWIQLIAAALWLCPATPSMAWPVLRAPAFLDLLPANWTDDNGQRMSLPALRGRRIVMTMAYSSCRRTCATTILRLHEIQRVLDAKGESAEFIIVTYDYENDDPRAWTQYRKTRNLDRPNWHFLSGGKWDTRRVSWLLGLNFWTMDSHVIHDFKIVVLDSNGALDQEIGIAPVDFERLF